MSSGESAKLWKAVVVELKPGVTGEQCEAALSLNLPIFTTRFTNDTAKGFLLQYPPGAYTAGRTLNTVYLLDLPAHLSRLCSSVSDIKFTIPPPEDDVDSGQIVTCPVVTGESEPAEPAVVVEAMSPFRNPEELPKFVVPLMKKALAEWLASSASRVVGQIEAKVTVLITYSPKEGAKLVAHCDELIQPKAEKTDVIVYGMPRKNATAKDSRWVADRSALEKYLSPTINEVILTDPHLNIYEGLTSNFCAVLADTSSGGKPYVACAPLEYVLLGTILRMVRHVCEQESIEFRFEFPKASEAATWLGAFITSTSRAVLPIRAIHLNDGSPPIELPSTCETIDIIKRGLRKEMLDRASPLVTLDDIDQIKRGAV
ncbi:uncharacterized protein SPPG_04679 [Spizellomyces punctatus DAOM BR117]|uniref:Uncharacterized protein n=1 Tax=Spizellomyces punctatus (strain DAOM BR117) TaxID=645134 RepID=A0A0L0HHL4_SPIPD|nr:uncharacterized protein SPPG_04679 [Spizellomyces punctatus DAOM BR117]KND00355.1 hypothetical protein SPPG_04679 [Spizellomyces punctatus DAOM BR117]|eukprot:XP_016608394.1 hypothetical protein SPPG_04679 [Spizellomyces punctatus DAOM BR117]